MAPSARTGKSLKKSAAAKPEAAAAQEISRRQLYELVWQRPISVIAADLGISRNTLSKICDRLLIPYPMRGHRGRQAKGRIPELGPAPDGTPELIILSAQRARLSRRGRSRLSPERRREQILSVAADIVIRHGLVAVSMKRVAAQAGISETLIYRYFPTLHALFVHLARRELDAVRLGQIVGSAPPDDSLEGRIHQATMNYLTVMAERGGLLQILLNDPTIAENFRQEYRKDRQTIVRSLADAAVRSDGVPAKVAEAASSLSTAVTMRAGRMVVQKKMPLDLAFAMSHTVARATARVVARGYGKHSDGR
jgi:AcrR family transcriptional regulator